MNVFTKKISKIKLPIFSVILTVVLVGCRDKKTETLTEPKDILPVSEQVKEYVEKDHIKPIAFNDGYSAYFDFSDGMEYAYRNNAIRTNLESITHTVTANSSEWNVYSMADKAVEKQNLSQTELFNKIIQTKYDKIMAPIEKTLAQIIDEEKRSLLITDFEEYDYDSQLNKNVVEQQAYATKYFKEWLNKGGVIQFFITDYKEKSLNKKLFFVVFDSNDLQLTDVIRKSLLGNETNYNEYLLSATPYNVYVDYSYGRGGNYHSPTGQDIVTEVIETSENDKYVNFVGLNAEFYPMGTPWIYVPGNIYNVKAMEGGVCEGILSHLYIDLSANDTYEIKNLALNVYDVTNDLNNYSVYRSALRNTPDISEDEMGNKIIQFNSHPDAQFYYDVFTGEMLEQVKYKEQPSPKFEKLLKINNRVFEKSKSENSKKTHIAATLEDAYQNVTFTYDQNQWLIPQDPALQQQLNSLDGKIIRIDVCLGDNSFDYLKLDSMFSFDSKMFYKDGKEIRSNVGDNNCIYQSIRQVIQDINPQERVIYSYFMYNGYAF